MSFRSSDRYSARPSSAMSWTTESARPATARAATIRERPDDGRTPEQRMEQRWVAARHEAIVRRETALEHTRLLEEWERRRARADEETIRSQEAARFNSVVERRADRSAPPESKKVVSIARPSTAEPERLRRRNLEQDQLRRFRKLNQHILGAQPPPPETTYVSLSGYYEFRGEARPSAFKERGEPSSVLQNISKLWHEKHTATPTDDPTLPTLENIRLQQLQEVAAVQRALGRVNIACSAAVLANALVMPSQHMKPNVGCSALEPRLMENPFYDPEAKKKKKVGAKKKSRAGH